MRSFVKEDSTMGDATLLQWPVPFRWVDCHVAEGGCQRHRPCCTRILGPCFHRAFRDVHFALHTRLLPVSLRVCKFSVVCLFRGLSSFVSRSQKSTTTNQISHAKQRQSR
ncbi:MAG: hypothetical protein MHM6MM_006511 [Cercozoa sp. M6MM]